MSMDPIPHFDVDVFISDIEERPAIWDLKSELYSDRGKKTEAWEELCLKFIPNFSEKNVAEKNKPVISWVPTTDYDCLELQGQALEAGRDAVFDSPMWICRAYFSGDTLPGKAIPRHAVAFVTYSEWERKMTDFEILCTTKPEMFSWISCSDGEVPPRAIVGGHTSSGETLYIGRVVHMGSLIPGKIHGSHRCLYLGYRGKEISYKNYQVLCRKESS